MKAWLSSIIVFGLLASALMVHAESEALGPRERLEQALDEYAKALEETDRGARLAGFARAEAGFASLIERGFQNAELYSNLGNASLQAEQVGRAVVAYHRALRLDPDATKARQNLAHIRSRLPSWVPRRTTPDLPQTLFFYRRISQATRGTLAAGIFALGSLCFAISIRRREGVWRGAALAAGGIWSLLLASIVFDAEADHPNLAVITADETLARSADSRLAALAYPEPLPSGVEVDILEERAEWTRIRLENGRDVWVRASTLTRVVE